MSQGDIETATIFTRGMRKIQSKFTAIVSDISGKADQATTYTETEVDGLLDNKAAIAGQVFTGDIEAPKITASTGILFGTHTAASNTLDDYEEGTWTTTTSGLRNMTSLSITQEEYTKIGNMVFAQFKGSFSVASGSSVRTGFAFTLPFNQLTNSNALGGGGRVQSPSPLELNPAIADNTGSTRTTGYFSFISYESGSHILEVAIMYRGA